MKMPEIPTPSPDAIPEVDYREKAFRESCNAPVRHIETKCRQDNDWAMLAALTMTALRGVGAIVCVCGTRGTGKTQAAVQIMRDFHRSNLFPLYRTALELFYQLRATMGSDVSEMTVMNQHVSPALLVIDEVQVRGETTFELDRLTYLIDARYRANKRTLLISNLPTRKTAKGGACIEDNLGASIVSRIQETGKVIVYDCESFRLKTETSK